jgi:hypothetical protein
MRHSDTTQCTYQEHNAIVLITILSDYIIPQITSYILPCIHMYGMTHQKVLKTGIIAAILLVAAILTTTTTTATNVQAQSDRDANPGDNAWKAGWKEGKNDYLNGDERAYDCSSDMGDSYCEAYRTGYGIGWDKQADLGRAPGSDPRGDNGDDGESNETPKRTIGGNN